MSASQSLLDISLPSIDGVSQSFSTPTRNGSHYGTGAGIDQTPGPSSSRGFRAPSSSSTAPSSAPLATPPASNVDPHGHVNFARGAAARGIHPPGHGRRKSDLSFSIDKDREDVDGDDSAGATDNRTAASTAINAKRGKVPQKSAVTLTLRDQEKVQFPFHTELYTHNILN